MTQAPSAPADHVGRAPLDRTRPELTGSALTLVAPIARAEDISKLAFYLKEAGENVRTHPDFALPTLELVHFLRWVVLELGNGTRVLAFESNHDGTVEEHLEELVLRCGRGMRKAYSYCQDSPCAGDAACTDAALVSYLASLARPYAAFHVANHGFSATRILIENEARQAVEQWLTTNVPHGADGTPPAELYDRIVASLPPELLRALKKVRREPPPSIPLELVIFGLVILALPVLPLAVPLGIWLVYRERTDAVEDRKPDRDRIKELTKREDLQTQNQLTHVVELKPGLLRRWTLRTVLAVIDLFAKKTFNQGYLGPMSSIHFARWASIDEGRHLLFFSNYDGSWESYLGDFVDKAAPGLTAIWSNTDGFPRARFLLFDGAKDEDRFKSWTRLHQVETQLWYTAYKDLSVHNIRQNAAIAACLVNRPESSAAFADWLALL